jgi:hypothetical protein
LNAASVPRERIAAFRLDAEEIHYMNPDGTVKPSKPKPSPRMEVHLERIQLPPEYRSKSSAWSGVDNDSLYLICAQWEPGATYRIWMGNDQAILTHISTEPFVARPSKVEVWSNEQSVISTSTARGSCSTQFDARRVGVEMSGDDIDLWRDALLYLTIVDDKIAWRPVDDLCDSVAPGKSWVGTARELLYCDCAPEVEKSAHAPIWSLEAGKHTVRMIAWLPGVAQTVATTTVSLSCE